ncbi:FHA domain-containing protein [Psychrobacter sp. AOP5-GZ1-6]|uniref:FHA domain-containing protein n=1 Tax=unclassified Psychrobacter TaxID=196806 RepID=UPI00402BEFA9
MTTLEDNDTLSTNNSTWQLNALTEALGDLTLTVDDSLSIGRGSDNDVVLGSKQVSRNHAVLSLLDGQLYVKDLNSSNGTFINEQRIEGNQSSLLQADDTIGFASFRFQVKAPVAAPENNLSAPVAPDDVAVSKEVDTEAASAESILKEDEFEEYIIEHSAVDEPVVKETGIDDVLSTVESVSSAEEVESAPVEDTPEPIVEEVVLEESVSTKAVAEPQEVATMEPESPAVAESEPLVERPVATEGAVYEEINEAEVVDEKPVVEPEHDKTTKTTLQEEADPDILRAKQAATAQFSGTADLGQSHDLGTEGNSAKDQEVTNLANTGQPEKKPSGGWFIWVFIIIVIVALALWFFNKGTV